MIPDSLLWKSSTVPRGAFTITEINWVQCGDRPIKHLTSLFYVILEQAAASGRKLWCAHVCCRQVQVVVDRWGGLWGLWPLITTLHTVDTQSDKPTGDILTSLELEKKEIIDEKKKSPLKRYSLFPHLVQSQTGIIIRVQYLGSVSDICHQPVTYCVCLLFVAKQEASSPLNSCLLQQNTTL